MRKLKFILFGTLFFILITGCQTIKEKTDEIAKKENEKLSKYIGKSLNDLKTDLGLPDEDFKNEKGNYRKNQLFNLKRRINAWKLF